MRWNLDTFFKDGSRSAALADEMEQIKALLIELTGAFRKEPLNRCILKMQEIDLRFREVGSYISCLLAQDVSDQKAVQLKSELSELQALYEKVGHQFDEKLLDLDEVAFAKLLKDAGMKSISFYLHEKRQIAKEKASLVEENLISSLSIDGYHGWGEFYPHLISQIQIPFVEENEKKMLSAGQAENKLSHPDRKVRSLVFQKWEKTFTEKEGLFSQVLNHLAGFRWKIYEQRKWGHFLKEALLYNRMQEKTLQAMWSVIAKNKAPFVLFLNTKAKMLGLKKLAWYDVEAPIGKRGQAQIPYERAEKIIVEKFANFHPRMAEFAKRAFRECWIEAEDRPGKRPGGFCTLFPRAKQSRIFMTYSGTIINLATLAHELGHAYHNEMVAELPSFAQDYRMNVAESASTFAELIVGDAMLMAVMQNEEKIALLNDKIQRSVIFFMNIHARFLFESKFYLKRKQGCLAPEELNMLMQEAQREAYCEALSEWHPHFWAAKMHFYFTDVPFYNFPYTFGYLFSLGLYSRSQKEGSSFAQKYDALLRDTGVEEVEGLAKKHLGVDLTRENFWQEAIDVAIKDVDEFTKLI